MSSKAQQTPREAAEQVLGKAVHPKALDRLFELWPEAVVEVKHSSPDARYDGRPARWTDVIIYKTKDCDLLVHPTHRITRKSRCHPDDSFEKKLGIEKAFRMCLKEIKNRAKASW